MQRCWPTPLAHL
uniref:Uncharacterized protein n=1 Tax=Anguilla anguilla TaxID=7936 RepID=A0A0E9PP42_ANGAN